LKCKPCTTITATFQSPPPPSRVRGPDLEEWKIGKVEEWKSGKQGKSSPAFKVLSRELSDKKVL